MNKLVIAAAASLFAMGAQAAELPSKAAAKAPAEAPKKVEASADNTLTAGWGFETTPGSYNSSSVSKTKYTVGIDHNLGGGFSVGATLGTSQAQNSSGVVGAVKETVEATAAYKVPTFAGLTAKAGGAVGYSINTGSNYSYYKVNTGVDYKILDTVTLNLAGYQYRNAFDVNNDYEQHQVSTGGQYEFIKNNSLYVKAARNFDKSWVASNDEVTLGYKLKF